MDLKNKKVLVAGLGRSGLAAVKLLQDKGAFVFATELQKREISLPGVTVETGGHSREFVRGKDLLVISPGIDPRSPLLSWALASGVPVVSELELASWYVSCPLIAVTGTNGKSTVTSLIEHILKCGGKHAIACGNIGLPLSEVVSRQETFDAAVVEVSSFQLAHIYTFRPAIAVWLNFSLDHLDHHCSLEEYLENKINIFKNQTTADWSVINERDLNKIKHAVKSKIIVYGKKTGRHTVAGVFPENIAAAAAAARLSGIDAARIRYAVETFRPLPHRLQYVTTINNVDFIDDSKATNTASVQYALSGMVKPAVIILGGRDKGQDFRELRAVIGAKTTGIVALGEAQEKICCQLRNTVAIKKAKDMEEAVRGAFLSAAPGGVVLLSPGCSSFDMFKDYKDRGEVFQKCARNLRLPEEVAVA